MHLSHEELQVQEEDVVSERLHLADREDHGQVLLVRKCTRRNNDYYSHIRDLLSSALLVLIQHLYAKGKKMMMNKRAARPL